MNFEVKILRSFFRQNENDPEFEELGTLVLNTREIPRAGDYIKLDTNSNTYRALVKCVQWNYAKGYNNYHLTSVEIIVQ